jgi:hypothetical protein
VYDGKVMSRMVSTYEFVQWGYGIIFGWNKRDKMCVIVNEKTGDLMYTFHVDEETIAYKGGILVGVTVEFKHAFLWDEEIFYRGYHVKTDKGDWRWAQPATDAIFIGGKARVSEWIEGEVEEACLCHKSTDGSQWAVGIVEEGSLGYTEVHYIKDGIEVGKRRFEGEGLIDKDIIETHEGVILVMRESGKSERCKLNVLRRVGNEFRIPMHLERFNIEEYSGTEGRIKHVYKKLKDIKK